MSEIALFATSDCVRCLGRNIVGGYIKGNISRALDLGDGNYEGWVTMSMGRARGKPKWVAQRVSGL